MAGRLVTIRDMGKSQFVKILDRQGEIQLYVRKDVVGDAAYAAFGKLDLGDIVGAAGTLFRTKTGEVTVRVSAVTLLAKALRPGAHAIAVVFTFGDHDWPSDLSPAGQLRRVRRIREGPYRLAAYATEFVAEDVARELDGFGWT